VARQILGGNQSSRIPYLAPYFKQVVLTEKDLAGVFGRTERKQPASPSKPVGLSFSVSHVDKIAIECRLLGSSTFCSLDMMAHLIS
jgi:hypothetical protein